jgi:serine protease
MVSYRFFVLSLVVIGLLTACGGDRVIYSLNSVLPSPTTPGSTITAYGLLPANAEVYLGELRLNTTPIADGLQMILPESMIAGTQSIKISSKESAGQTLESVVQVLPKIQDVSLKGQTLTVKGFGWPDTKTKGVNVEVDVSGIRLTPMLSKGQLTATLSDTLAYGSLFVKVIVNDSASQSLTLTREASTLKGKVVFPASTLVAQNSIQTRETKETSSQTSLIVYHSPTNGLSSLGSGSCTNNKANLKMLDTSIAACVSKTTEGLRSWQSSSKLRASKLEYSSHDAAQKAFTDLTTKGHKVEWDVPVYIDGSANLNVLPTDGAGQWHLGLIGTEEAWNITKGAGIVIGILDTGVMLDHPDLQPNLLPGYDFIDNDTEPYDNAGHGTHVAGLAAANGQVLGTAPEAKILPVRVLEGTSGGSAFTVAQGILWAAGLGDTANPNPAQVINLSLGSDSYSAIMAAAIEQVQKQGVIVVAATGNAGGSLAYPAALPAVVAVTSLAGPDIPYQPWYANKGLGTWITAYGGDTTQDQNKDGVKDGILSTDLGGYGLRMGTSMASPQIAGLVALALAGGSSKEMARDVLANNASEIGPMGYDLNFGYGLGTGRVATGSSPRSYVVALDSSNKILGWTLLQNNNQYELLNIPAGTVSVYAASDEDNDGRLGEAGELISSGLSISALSTKTVSVGDLTLAISKGQKIITLEARQ